MSKLFVRARNLFSRREEGATMIEYGLMVALIAVVCIVTITALGLSVDAMFAGVAAAL